MFWLASEAGVRRSVGLNTIGEVAQAGQQMMVIVPDGTRLEVEAMLLNKDRGFVREGQDVRIKLEAFPFTRYGTLNGEVMTVSTDAVPFEASRGAASDIAQSAAGALVFPIRISLEETKIEAGGESVALNPGMSVTAEVKTGDRRVIEFLLGPLIRMQDEALHER